MLLFFQRRPRWNLKLFLWIGVITVLLIVWGMLHFQAYSATTVLRASHPISQLAYHETTNRIAGGSHDGTLHIWQVDTGKEVCFIQAHRGSVTGLIFNKTGDIVVSSGVDGHIKWWDIHTGTLIQEIPIIQVSQDMGVFTEDVPIQTTTIGIFDLVKHSASGTLIAGGVDGQIAVLDIQTGKLRFIVKGHPITNNIGHFWNIYAVAISSDGNTIASGGQDGRISLWNAQTGALLKELNDEATDSILDLAFIQNDRVIAVHASSIVEVWDVHTATVAYSDEIPTFDIPSSDFSPNRALFARGGPTYNGAPTIIPFFPFPDHSVYLERISDFEILQKYTGHTDTITSVLFAESGEFLITGSNDKTVRVWAVTP